MNHQVVYCFHGFSGSLTVYRVERNTPKCLFLSNPGGGFRDTYRLAKQDLNRFDAWHNVIYCDNIPDLVAHMNTVRAKVFHNRGVWDGNFLLAQQAVIKLLEPETKL